MRERLDRSLSGDVYVALEFALDVWSVEVDPGELELVVLNLAVNARDAVPDGGNITIKANNVTLANDDLAGDFVRLAIVDMGTRISRDVLDRVFEAFFTTKDVGKGSGLGLAQVHGFATQSGGKVEIISNIGEGTSIILFLPRSTRVPTLQARHVVDQSERGAALGKVTNVLLVEDDYEVGSLAADMFW